MALPPTSPSPRRQEHTGPGASIANPLKFSAFVLPYLTDSAILGARLTNSAHKANEALVRATTKVIVDLSADRFTDQWPDHRQGVHE